MQYITSGHGAMPPDGWFPAQQTSVAKAGVKLMALSPGFAAVQVDESGCNIALIDKEGKTLYSTILTNLRLPFPSSDNSMITVNEEELTVDETLLYIVLGFLGAVIGMMICGILALLAIRESVILYGADLFATPESDYDYKLLAASARNRKMAKDSVSGLDEEEEDHCWNDDAAESSPIIGRQQKSDGMV